MLLVLIKAVSHVNTLVAVLPLAVGSAAVVLDCLIDLLLLILPKLLHSTLDDRIRFFERRFAH